MKGLGQVIGEVERMFYSVKQSFSINNGVRFLVETSIFLLDDKYDTDNDKCIYICINPSFCLMQYKIANNSQRKWKEN